MAIEETQRFCRTCQRNVLARRAGTNHVLHLILTLFTCVWGIIWFLSAIKIGGWRCAYCGSKV